MGKNAKINNSRATTIRKVRVVTDVCGSVRFSMCNSACHSVKLFCHTSEFYHEHPPEGLDKTRAAGFFLVMKKFKIAMRGKIENGSAIYLVILPKFKSIGFFNR